MSEPASPESDPSETPEGEDETPVGESAPAAEGGDAVPVGESAPTLPKEETIPPGEHEKTLLGIKLHNWIFVGMILGVVFGLMTYGLDPFDSLQLNQPVDGVSEVRGHTRLLKAEQVYVVMTPGGIEKRFPAANVAKVEKAADRAGGRWHSRLLWWFNLFGKVLFLGALKMIVAPLVLASIIAGIVSLSGLDQLKTIGFKTIAYYMLTTTIAVTIGLVVVLTLKPGKMASSQQLRAQRVGKLEARAAEYRELERQEPFKLEVRAGFKAFYAKHRDAAAPELDLASSLEPEVEAWALRYRKETKEEAYERGAGTPGYLEWLVVVESKEAGTGHEGARMAKLSSASGKNPGDVFVDGVVKPMLTNPFESLANAKSLGIIFFAVLLGVAIVVVGGRARVVADFFIGFNDVIIWITTKLMAFAPFCVMCLVASLVGEKGPAVFATLAWYCIAVVGGILLHVGVLVAIASTLGGCSPKRLWSGLREALMIAFTTRSSAATLPVTMKCVTEKLGVSPKVANFALPVGATMNMDGTALYEGVAVIFLIQIFGGLVDAPFELTFAVTLVIFVTAVLASIGAAAVPDAGLVTMVLVAEAVHLPVYYIPLIFAVDAFLDMFRTTTNVLGDSVGSLVVHRMEEGTPAMPSAG